MKRTVVGLTGYAQTGKDTVGQILTGHRGYTRFSFADNVREAVYRLNPIIDHWCSGSLGHAEPEAWTVQQLVDHYGWDHVKVHYPEARRLLQVMGTEIGREMFGYDSWIKMTGRQVQDHTEHGGRVVFTDVRFQNEADYIRSAGGIVVRVEREGTGPVNDHASDRIDFPADLTIQNNGTIGELTDLVLQLDSVGWSS